MPRREVPLIAGEYYHIYNRGNNRQVIFFEEENYLFFLRRLRHHLSAGKTFEVLETSEVSKPLEVYTTSVVAYCLMPTHYHLITQPHDDALSHHLQMFTISYTKAINKRYERVGALFQGAFRAKCIDRDEYLLHLSRYIHLNPVRARLVKRPEDWPFSSYRDYIGLRQGTLPQAAIVLDQFPTRQAYQVFVASYAPADAEKIAHLRFEDD